MTRSIAAGAGEPDGVGEEDGVELDVELLGQVEDLGDPRTDVADRDVALVVAPNAVIT